MLNLSTTVYQSAGQDGLLGLAIHPNIGLGTSEDFIYLAYTYDNDPVLKDYIPYAGVAEFSSGSYASFLHGNVVDMLYFPMFKGHFPDWFPFVGGDPFEFFSPIFNIADASISIGVITLLLFQKRFFKKNSTQAVSPTVETNAEVSDKMQVL